MCASPGTLTPQKSTLGMYPLRPVYDPNKLPRRFDARQQWTGQLAPIQDQGWCGSSWAISTAAVASDKSVLYFFFLTITPTNGYSKLTSELVEFWVKR